MVISGFKGDELVRVDIFGGLIYSDYLGGNILYIVMKDVVRVF